MIVSYDPTTSDKQFPVAPEGLHQAVCVDVVDLGMVDQTFEGKTKKVHKCRLVFEIEEKDPDTGKPLQASQFYTVSLHPESRLRKHLRSWRGRDFTDDELRSFDLETLVGINGQIQVEHKPSSNGKTYANVTAIVKLGKGMVAMRPSPEYVRVKDRPPKENAAQSAAVPRSADDDSVPF